MNPYKATVLVTGASGALGAEMIKRISSDPTIRVIGQYFSQVPANTAGKNIIYSKCDFRNCDSVETWIKDLSKEYGPFDGIVNNAGSLGESTDGFLNRETSQIVETLNVNLVAALVILTHVLDGMVKKRAGRIINVSSIGVKFGGSPQTPFYSIAKAGLEQSTRALVKCAAKQGVIANTLRVGVVDSKLQKQKYANNPEGFKDRVNLIPSGHATLVSEVAEMVNYLLFDAPHSLNGSVIDLAGGE